MQPSNQFLKSPIIRKIGVTLLGFCAAILCSPFGVAVSMWLPVSPLPRPLYAVCSWMFSMSWFFSVLGILMMLAGPIYALVKSARVHQMQWGIWICWMAFSGFWWGSTLCLNQVIQWRRPGLMRITQNAKPLIAAIEQYKKTVGVYPPDLDALSPKFIAQIPHTGAPGYPEFKYKIATANTPYSAYELYVFTPKGLSNFDDFFYWPEKNYPPTLGDIEQIGDWAYFYE